MELLQYFHIHTGFIIIAFGKTAADDLHQVRIAGIVLRQQHQMMVTVLTAGQFLVKTGIGRHVHLTAQDRLDPRFSGCTVKIDHTIHNTMIGDRRAVHAQFLDSGYIFFNLIGSVQQRIFCMDMKMGKRHFAVPFLVPV